VAAELAVAGGEVLLLQQVLERRGEAVGAVLGGHAARLPERVLQPVREGDEALAALDHLGVLPAREGEGEVVEPVGERDAGDRHPEAAGVGEVGQAEPGRGVRLREEHLLGRAGERPPVPDPALQGAQHAVEAAGVEVLQVLEDGGGEQARVGGQERHDLGLPDVGERVGPRAPPAARRLGGQDRVGLEAAGGADADRDLGGGDFLGVGTAERHVAGDLSVGDPIAGHSASSRCD
jgi:hypothetical protein